LDLVHLDHVILVSPPNIQYPLVQANIGSQQLASFQGFHSQCFSGGVSSLAHDFPRIAGKKVVLLSLLTSNHLAGQATARISPETRKIAEIEAKQLRNNLPPAASLGNQIRSNTIQ
jgi:hypothetical protein